MGVCAYAESRLLHSLTASGVQRQDVVCGLLLQTTFSLITSCLK